VRPMHPITLTLSTGRCGTTFLERTFKEAFEGSGGWISHEHLKNRTTLVGVYHRGYSEELQKEMLNPEIEGLLAEWKRISADAPVVDFGWTMRSLVPYLHRTLGGQFRALYLHRHPVAYAASSAILGSYTDYNSPSWAITPDHPRALYPQFRDRWSGMTPYEKCLYLWLEVNGFAREVRERYPALPFLEVKSSDLFRSKETLARVAFFTGFSESEDVVIEPSEDRNERNVFSRERRPIRDEWRSYRKHPEVVAMGESLGYRMDEDFVGSFIGDYQLPRGVMPYLRNVTGYWTLRSHLGQLLRNAGLRGERPRSPQASS
jgi:hypothetical protein